MTVAAVILAHDPDAALALAGSTTRLRRIADVAWSGGAVPTVIVCRDPAGRLTVDLAGVEATLVADPLGPAGGVGAALAGTDRAAAIVEATDAALLWPIEMAWVDPETVTSLIETHGADRSVVLRPTYRARAGWPALVPRGTLDIWRGFPPETPIAVALETAAVRLLELGDPGVVLDAATPPEALPPYVGPSAPPAGHAHEWGEAVADAVAADSEPDPS